MGAAPDMHGGCKYCRYLAIVGGEASCVLPRRFWCGKRDGKESDDAGNGAGRDRGGDGGVRGALGV